MVRLNLFVVLERKTRYRICFIGCMMCDELNNSRTYLLLDVAGEIQLRHWCLRAVELTGAEN